MGKKWNWEDEEFLIENYGTIPIIELAIIMNKTESSIYHMSSRLGLKEKFLTKEQIEKRNIRRKEYKANWFQENKGKIRESRRKNPIPTELARHYNFKSTYGITLEDYNKMLDKQNFKCCICGKEHIENTFIRRLRVDHNHETGEIRGLLCHECNIGLGFFNDSIEILLVAIKYLKGEKDE